MHIVYLWLPDVELALARVAERVRAGGHDVPADAVRRRFDRGRVNFFTIYRPLANAWRLYDATPITARRSSRRAALGCRRDLRRRETWEMAAQGFES